MSSMFTTVAPERQDIISAKINMPYSHRIGSEPSDGHVASAFELSRVLSCVRNCTPSIFNMSTYQRAQPLFWAPITFFTLLLPVAISLAPVKGSKPSARMGNLPAFPHLAFVPLCFFHRAEILAKIAFTQPYNKCHKCCADKCPKEKCLRLKGRIAG